jgi:hypothetical protein
VVYILGDSLVPREFLPTSKLSGSGYGPG